MNVKHLLVTAAVAGMLAGAAPAQDNTTQPADKKPAAEKNSCKGKQSCNGKKAEHKGSKKDADKDAKMKEKEAKAGDKNSCNGKNGCNGKTEKPN